MKKPKPFATEVELCSAFLSALPKGWTAYAETRKAAAFREHIRQIGGRFSDLPRGSFSWVGTSVNTLLLTVQPGRRM